MASKIVNAIPEADRPIFLFMAYYALRPGEARALQWRDIDFDKKEILIRRTWSKGVLKERTKTGRITPHTLMPEIEELLKPFRGIGEAFVFTNKDEKPYSAKLSLIWNKARDRINAPKVKLYESVRHSTAIDKSLNDWPLPEIQAFLGHSLMKTTMRYAKVTQPMYANG